MKRQTGFTLIELLVVIVMLGVLAATGVTFMAKYRQRTVGSEALVMMKQVLEGEIMYFLEHNEFLPEDVGAEHELWVFDDGSGTSAVDQKTVLDALKVAIPTGHLLDFRIYRLDLGPGYQDEERYPVGVDITSVGNFNLVPDFSGIRGTVNKQGTITGPDPF
jgi:prepilin-type N-terminal cleavage/methylation domain-containing protein